MSLHLILMRHAKSDWSVEGQSDHDRSLNGRGRRNAPAMAKWLAGEGWRPDLILCSSSVRTSQTAVLLNANWTRPAEVFHLNSLYLSTSQTILEVIRSDAWREAAGSGGMSSVRNLMVLAHNPGISDAASRLIVGNVHLSTAAAMVWRCGISDWSERIDPGSVELVAQMCPKQLDAPEEGI